jgi:hypothetical protein
VLPVEMSGVTRERSFRSEGRKRRCKWESDRRKAQEKLPEAIFDKGR